MNLVTLSLLLWTLCRALHPNNWYFDGRRWWKYVETSDQWKLAVDGDIYEGDDTNWVWYTGIWHALMHVEIIGL